MPYSVEGKLVVAVASRALFDLEDANRIYTAAGIDAYREHQRGQEGVALARGAAFAFVSRLLHLNEIRPADPLVEVVLISRNDCDTGLRVMNSIRSHGLDISRAVFASGRTPYAYLAPLNAALFLSASDEDVLAAGAAGAPAGLVVPGEYRDDSDERELRVAFDFDGVLAGDEAERIYRETNLSTYHATEKERAAVPLSPGPLRPLLEHIARIQKIELERNRADQTYRPILRTAIVTARDAPAHERAIRTLRAWNLSVDEALFLGGLPKPAFLSVLKPHIYFDDQLKHLQGLSDIPGVHIPFGVCNPPRATAGRKPRG